MFVEHARAPTPRSPRRNTRPAKGQKATEFLRSSFEEAIANAQTRTPSAPRPRVVRATLQAKLEGDRALRLAGQRLMSRWAEAFYATMANRVTPEGDARQVPLRVLSQPQSAGDR